MADHRSLWIVIRDDIADPFGREDDAHRHASDCGEGDVVEYAPAEQLRGAVALLEEVRKRSHRPFGGHAPYDLAARIEHFLDDGVYEPHPATVEEEG